VTGGGALWILSLSGNSIPEKSRGAVEEIFKKGVGKGLGTFELIELGEGLKRLGEKFHAESRSEERGGPSVLEKSLSRPRTWQNGKGICQFCSEGGGAFLRQRRP